MGLVGELGEQSCITMIGPACQLPDGDRRGQTDGIKGQKPAMPCPYYPLREVQSHQLCQNSVLADIASPSLVHASTYVVGGHPTQNGSRILNPLLLPFRFEAEAGNIEHKGIAQ